MHLFTLVLLEDLSAVKKVVDIPLYKNEDDFIDPIEEPFDNIQHPRELELLNRAYIPYVSMLHLYLLGTSNCKK